MGNNLKRGFFGGTFDPIHNGHINLLVELLEQSDLEEIIVCPANVSPFKMDAPPAVSGEHRANMVELAISDIPGLSLSTIEIERDPPSFTIETLRALDGLLRLILSADALPHFFNWELADEIVELAPPIIAGRGGFETKNFSMIPELYRDTFKKGYYEIPQMEISSTGLRDRLANNLYCGHLLPPKVVDYISSNRLY